MKVATLLALPLLSGTLSAATVVNIDISRDNSGPLGGLADVLYVGAGPSSDTGTFWNDYSISLDGAGSTIPVGYSLTNLLDSFGGATTVGLTMTSGWYRTFNSSGSNNLQGERAFTLASGGSAIATVTGLTANGEYSLWLFSDGNLNTSYLVDGNTKTATGAGFLQPVNAPGYGDGVQYAEFLSVFADGSGNLQITATGIGNQAALAGLQLEAVPEPSSSLLLLCSVLGLGLRRRR